MYNTLIKPGDDNIYQAKPYLNNQSYQSSFDRPQILMVVDPVMGQPVCPQQFTNFEGYRNNISTLKPMHYDPQRQTLIIVQDRVLVRRRRRNALIILIVFVILFITFFSVFWFY